MIGFAIAALVALSACGVSVSSTSQEICTITDCPEGVSLADMRSGAESDAYDAGARSLDRSFCLVDAGIGSCYVEFRNPFSGAKKTLVCDWGGCERYYGCDYLIGCHLEDGWMR